MIIFKKIIVSLDAHYNIWYNIRISKYGVASRATNHIAV